MKTEPLNLRDLAGLSWRRRPWLSASVPAAFVDFTSATSPQKRPWFECAPFPAQKRRSLKRNARMRELRHGNTASVSAISGAYCFFCHRPHHRPSDPPSSSRAPGNRDDIGLTERSLRLRIRQQEISPNSAFWHCRERRSSIC